jgi:acetyl-CoA carboxylase carboxyltransferase component
MVDGVSNMYITGPDVIRAVTGEEVTHEDLGGAAAHAVRSGVAHARFATEAACFSWTKQLLSILPPNAATSAPLGETDDPPDRLAPEIASIIPQNEHAAYDVRDVIAAIADAPSGGDPGFLEIHREYAANVVVGFARLAGRTTGFMASQPSVLAGALDINASDKAARFVRFCDAFGIPVVSLADVPGFLPGVAQEHGGIIRHGAKLLYAIAEATVPKVALVLRKAYGGAYICTASRRLGYDRVLALPSARIAVMGAEGAANVIFRRQIKAAEDPAAERERRVEEFRESVMDPGNAARLGFVDAIIEPEQARKELIRSLETLSTKQEHRAPRKHGNLPL